MLVYSFRYSCSVSFVFLITVTMEMFNNYVLIYCTLGTESFQITDNYRRPCYQYNEPENWTLYSVQRAVSVATSSSNERCSNTRHVGINGCVSSRKHVSCLHHLPLLDDQSKSLCIEMLPTDSLTRQAKAFNSFSSARALIAVTLWTDTFRKT